MIPNRFGTKAVAMLALFRVLTAVYLVKTFFDPDEFWQSTEIAHRFVFGYGYETWEWKPFARIRGFAYPSLFAMLFKALEWTGMDGPRAIILGPRILQAMIATVGDVYLYRLCTKWFDQRIAAFALLCQILDWFFLTSIIRTISNSTETVLTILALNFWPESSSKEPQNRQAALFVASLTVIVRPASVLFWLILFLVLLLQSRDRLRLVLFEAVPIGALALAASIVMDYWYYRTWTFTMWNFVKFNLGSARCSGAAMYGVHPYHWYVTQGLPAMLSILLPFFVIGVYRCKRLFPLSLVILSIALLSSNAHKEFRFILPTLPFCFMYCGVALADLQARFQTRKLFGSLYIPSLVFLFVSNLVASVYFSRWHQAGPMTLLDQIANNPDSFKSIDFLTSCHSTPFYSNIHRHIPLRILECEPRFEGNECVGDRSASDSEMFLKAPAAFVKSYYEAHELPSHIVIFDDHYSELELFFHASGFVVDRRIFHSHFADYKELLLLRRFSM